MLIENFQSKIYKKEVFFLFGLYLTLLISFYFGEDSTGGAYMDYHSHKLVVKEFKENFISSFLNYNNLGTRHSPVLIIILSFLEKLISSDTILRLIHLHFCLLLPFFFFKTLEIKYKDVDNKILLLLTSLIFLSPTFRSLSIWPDSRLLGITVFTISIFYYLKFLDNKNFLFVILNILFCALGSYLSPNFCVFSIFFFSRYLSEYKLLSKEIFFIIILNFLIAFPAFFYVFIMEINFFNKSAAIERETSDIMFVNIFNDILITFSFLFFYIIPFIFLKIIKNDYFLTIKNFALSLIVFLICAYNFDYNYLNSGGGFFFKISQTFFGNNHIFFLVSFISIITFLPILLNNKYNFLLFVLILLNNPQYTMYHKYFDPFLIIIFFTIFFLNVDLRILSKIKSFLFVFFYFFSFLIISNIKFLWKI